MGKAGRFILTPRQKLELSLTWTFVRFLLTRSALTDKPGKLFCLKPLNPKKGANAICGVLTRFRQPEVKNGLKPILYMNEQSPISRRQAISGLVAVAVPQVFAAGVYVQLAANDASYATGQVYGSSGGSGRP